MAQEILTVVVEKLFSIRLFGAAIGGLIISILFTVIVGFLIQAYTIDSVWPYVSILDSKLAVTLFASCFFTFSVLFYFLTYKEREDILTPIRKQLSGTWKIVYEAFDFDSHGKVEVENRVEICEIGIDETTAKLFMLVKTVANDIFAAAEIRIDDITINPSSDPKRMTYYHVMRVNLTERARELLAIDSVTAPIFGMLTFSLGSNAALQLLKGEWYDLDGTFSRLISRYQTLVNPGAAGEIPTHGQMTFERWPIASAA